MSEMSDAILEQALRPLLEIRDAVEELASPNALLKPRLFKDGNQWCALYGANLQEGIAGFGDTPFDAVVAFNKQFYEDKA